MHPNDGFELGLLQAEHVVRLCLSLTLEEFLKGSPDEGDPVSLSLRNECPGETLLVGAGLYRRLGKPAKAVVLYDGDRLFVQGRLG